MRGNRVPHLKETAQQTAHRDTAQKQSFKGTWDIKEGKVIFPSQSLSQTGRNCREKRPGIRELAGAIPHPSFPVPHPCPSMSSSINTAI